MTPATILEHDGISQPITEWALDYGITPAIIIGRLERGETVAIAITRPMQLGLGRQRLVLPDMEAFIAGERDTWRREHRKVRRRKAHVRPPRQSVRRTIGQTYTHNGTALTIPEWAEATGIKAATIRFRLKAGWPLGKALSEDVRNQSIRIAELAREGGIDPRTVDSRMRRGWSRQDALTIAPGARMGRPRKHLAGVASNFASFEGTGGGRGARDCAEISFSDQKALTE